MQIDKIKTISGRGVPVRGNDIDTDRIIPARFLKTIVFDGLGAHAFADDRVADKAAGRVHPFDDPRFAGATVLLANLNFGCGSSREHAPQALKRWGIRVVIGESFAEIFRGNCQTIGVPVCVVAPAAAKALQDLVAADPQAEVTVDLDKREVRCAKQVWPLQLPDGVRQAFLEGTWDPTAELLSAKARIETVVAALPYFRNWKGPAPVVTQAEEPVVAAVPAPVPEPATTEPAVEKVVKKSAPRKTADKADKPAAKPKAIAKPKAAAKSKTVKKPAAGKSKSK